MEATSFPRIGKPNAKSLGSGPCPAPRVGTLCFKLQPSAPHCPTCCCFPSLLADDRSRLMLFPNLSSLLLPCHPGPLLFPLQRPWKFLSNRNLVTQNNPASKHLFHNPTVTFSLFKYGCFPFFCLQTGKVSHSYLPREENNHLQNYVRGEILLQLFLKYREISKGQKPL